MLASRKTIIYIYVHIFIYIYIHISISAVESPVDSMTRLELPEIAFPPRPGSSFLCAREKEKQEKAVEKGSKPSGKMQKGKQGCRPQNRFFTWLDLLILAV